MAESCLVLLPFGVWKHTVSMLHLAPVIGMDGLTTMGRMMQEWTRFLHEI